MEIKPGKYVQRNGDIATVAAINESKPKNNEIVGWDADGDCTCWDLTAKNNDDNLDLVREHREPREWWIVAGLAATNKEDAENYAKNHKCKAIHVREVTE